MSDEDKAIAYWTEKARCFTAYIVLFISAVLSGGKKLVIELTKAVGWLLFIAFISAWVVTVMYLVALMYQHGIDGAIEILHYRFLKHTGQLPL